jgi:DNA replication ATP-dependent helicase Dna2
MPEKTTLLSDYLAEIQELDQSGLSIRNKYILLKRILERSCKGITESESLQFPSLFSRLVFIAQKYGLPKQLEWQLQNLRIKAAFLNKDEQNIVSSTQYDRARKSVRDFLRFIESGTGHIASEDISVIEDIQSTYFDKLRVQVVSINKDENIFICKSDIFIGQPVKVRYNVPSINDFFTETIENLWLGAQLNLIEAKKDEQGNYIPRLFVFEPDYLIDASAMAECFQSYGCSYLHYFRRKFEPAVSSPHILLGNLANFFLDELVYAKDAESVIFQNVFMKSFRSMPFEYASCEEIRDNAAFKEFMQKAESQFENIRRVVLYDMTANGFDLENCILEPSFICEKYGFQGRLDLFQPGEDADRIIELKSGKPPYPREDVTKIAPNHEVQTAIYRMMIQTVYGKDSRQIYPSILYSSAENAGENLRYVATYKQLEKEIINERNKIIATEYSLYNGDISVVEVFFNKLLDPDSYGRIPQFFEDKLKSLKKVLDKASGLEKQYFFRFVSFVSRELYLQKLGDEGYSSSMSIAALWNTDFEERREALELVSELEIEEIDDSGRDMIIRFRRQDKDECVNFREGEICILYPRQGGGDTVLTNQILKGTIVDVSTDSIILRFRYKQRNRNFFDKYRLWTVEHDKLDHAYTAMLKGSFTFLSCADEKKKLLLGLTASRSSYIEIPYDELSKQQKEEKVIDKAIQAEDYFLIVGPPGTGKTSIFARKLIERFYTEEDSNILVIAYTNRAVDELCSAVCAAFGEDETICDKYIRIGSELSCDKPYRDRLLQSISSKAKSRKELLNTIVNTRIFVGTLASVTGKPEIFNLKRFNVAIIDEASQILEPQIIGMLPQFDKFIMIGDHKQLSTITLQNEYKSKVNNDLLKNIYLYDCRESLFERLFHLCKQKGWHSAYETLTYHGRMHEDISNLINARFYENQLIPATSRQKETLAFPYINTENQIQTLIANKRIGFIPVKKALTGGLSDKTNEEEADIVVTLARNILDIYKSNEREFTASTLGIITPYRNQIALIKHKLEETGVPELKNIMIDTVERYQGSQRDIIIISFCFNKPYQLRYFTNMNREGTVDRKLNVALTRAREQLFLIGNPIILNQNSIYKDLLDEISTKDYKD